MTQSTLILGLGNTLLSDEGVGPLVVQHLKEEADPAAPLQFLDGGTLSFSLAGPIEDCHCLIVVDAAAMGDPPGSVRVFEGETMDRRLRQHAKSVHEVSLADLLDMVRLTDRLPERRALVGIEPAVVDWGDSLTPAVEAAVPMAMARVKEMLRRWNETETGGSIR
ncbi:HyaD/HybD family hydrogenase maturation endopeptidase [Thiorhodovibrio frisius]|uniref:Hydrogenase maturation protease n=1 Tax=Thiorhodovibrio frisius TaxID=631362 RepID=H8Z5P3_9GAMM|nr:HyaD/HybD family hydrogenase maturation endopeptidase [Thiorhodovibrio frisius]EIC19527.1 hydrogenase maturation protease [Thiorhodovibrio frisius]WPL20510.1 Hydrogenase 2 maturation protease [Thiorhodovibrio frisius]